MKTRERLKGIASLLDLKHELELQALSRLSAERRKIEGKVNAINQMMADRLGADDLSATTGNDARWAGRAAIERQAAAEELRALTLQEFAQRRRAEVSLGRTEVFRKLSGRLEV